MTHSCNSVINECAADCRYPKYCTTLLGKGISAFIILPTIPWDTKLNLPPLFGAMPNSNSRPHIWCDMKLDSRHLFGVVRNLVSNYKKLKTQNCAQESKQSKDKEYTTFFLPVYVWFTIRILLVVSIFSGLAMLNQSSIKLSRLTSMSIQLWLAVLNPKHLLIRRLSNCAPNILSKFHFVQHFWTSLFWTLAQENNGIEVLFPFYHPPYYISNTWSHGSQLQRNWIS